MEDGLTLPYVRKCVCVCVCVSTRAARPPPIYAGLKIRTIRPRRWINEHRAESHDPTSPFPHSSILKWCIYVKPPPVWRHVYWIKSGDTAACDGHTGVKPSLWLKLDLLAHTTASDCSTRVGMTESFSVCHHISVAAQECTFLNGKVRPETTK